MIPTKVPTNDPLFSSSKFPTKMPATAPTQFSLTSLQTSLNFSDTSTIALIGLCVLFSVVFVFVGVRQNSNSQSVELKFLAFHSNYPFYIVSISTLAIALIMLVSNDGLNSFTLTVLLFGNSFVAQISTIIGCKYYRAYCCWGLCGAQRCAMLGYIWMIILFIINIVICDIFLWNTEKDYESAVTVINALLCYYLAIGSFGSRIAQIHLCFTAIFLAVVIFGNGFSLYLVYWQLITYVILSIIAMFTLSQYHRLRILFFKVVASFLSLFDIATDIFVVSVWFNYGRIWEPLMQLGFIFSGTVYSAIFIKDYYNIHEDAYDSSSSDEDVDVDDHANRVRKRLNLKRRKMVGRVLTCLGFGRIYHGVLGWDESKNRDMMVGTKILKVWEMIFEGYPTIIFQFYIQLNAMFIGGDNTSSGLSLSIIASLLSLTNSFMRILYFDHRARIKKENLAINKRLVEKQRKPEYEVQLIVSSVAIQNSRLNRLSVATDSMAPVMDGVAVAVAGTDDVLFSNANYNGREVNIDSKAGEDVTEINIIAGRDSIDSYGNDGRGNDTSSSHGSSLYSSGDSIVPEEDNAEVFIRSSVSQPQVQQVQIPSAPSYQAPKPMQEQISPVILSQQQLQLMQQQLQQQQLQHAIPLSILMQQQRQDFITAKKAGGYIGSKSNINLHLDFQHPHLSHIRDLGFTRQQILTAYQHMLKDRHLQKDNNNDGCCDHVKQVYTDMYADVDDAKFADSLLDIIHTLKITALRNTRDRSTHTSKVIDFLSQNCVCCFGLRHFAKPEFAIIAIDTSEKDEGGWKFNIHDYDNIFYFLIYLFFMTDFYVRIYPGLLYINVVREHRFVQFSAVLLVIASYSYFMYYRMLKSDCKTYKNALRFFWTGFFSNTYWFLSTMYLPYLPTNVEFKPMMEEQYIRLSFQIVWMVILLIVQIYVDESFHDTLLTSILFIVCAVIDVGLTLIIFKYRVEIENKIAVKLDDEVREEENNLEDKH